MNNINYYDWIPFFAAINTEINKLYHQETREHQLYLKAKATFHSDHPILQVEHVDPFSYIYALAQRNTKNQRIEAFTNAKKAFDIEIDLPTDLVFPTPMPVAKALFYAKGRYITNEGEEIGSKAIWDLFNEVLNNKPVSNENFTQVLSLKNVGVVKLTQALFLVNPAIYIPFDTQMNSLPVVELDDLQNAIREVENRGFSAYRDVIEKLSKAFPCCNMYEINLLNVLINSIDEYQLRITNNYCQVSSWAYGQKAKDFFDDFVTQNAVWTGGATSETGKTEYPLTDFKRGDVVLVRKGTKNIGGIGIILQNEYLPDGYNEDSKIKILWLTKEHKWTEDALAQWVGLDWATDRTRNTFKELYPKIFDILNQIRNKQRVMINHSIYKFKNIILQGPPGTGKTRLAKQIAAWLTDGNSKNLSIMEAVEGKIFINEPHIEDVSEVKFIQFHPSYTYEDFVRGIISVVNDGKVRYEVIDKILAKTAGEAAKPENQSKAFVLIIDEINRANLPSVLGELIYALEYRGKPVTAMYSLEGNDQIVLPPNLYIIGTMNTADRSVGHIDYAIRRRFGFISVLPDPDIISNDKARELFNKIKEIFNDHISSDFTMDDVLIGHSYFLCDENEISVKLKYEVKPILFEYIKDGILLPSAEIKIRELNA